MGSSRLTGPSSHSLAINALETELIATGQLNYKELGWEMHLLPDTSVYFTHSGLRVVSDVDLRRPTIMREVTEYLGKTTVLPEGWELWISHIGKSAGERPTRFWIHHDKRLVIRPSLEISALEDINVSDLESELGIVTFQSTH
jgi:hypothetical protein